MAEKAKPKTTAKAATNEVVDGGVNPNAFVPTSSGGATASSSTTNGGFGVTGAGVTVTDPTGGITPSAYQLPAAIANAIVPASKPAKTATPAPDKTLQGQSVRVPTDEAQRLLTAYKDAFGKGKKLSPADVSVLAKLPGEGQLVTDLKDRAQGLPQNARVAVGGNFLESASKGLWDDAFGGGRYPTYTVAALKREAAKAISEAVPGVTSEEILSHDPDDVENIPASKALVKSMANRGYLVEEGQPIGDAIEKISSGNAGISKAAEQADETSGPETAQATYDKLIAAYENANPAEKQRMEQALANGGYLQNIETPTLDDLKEAYTQVVTEAVQKNEPIDTAISAPIANTNPDLSAANAGPQAAEVINTADRLGVSFAGTEGQRKLNQIIAEATSGTGTDGTQGWSQAQIDQAVAGQFTLPTNAQGQFDPTQLSGDAASIYKGFQTILNQYQIPMSAPGLAAHLQAALKNSVTGINEGNATDNTADFAQGTSAATAAFQQYAQQTAAALYPQFATQIAEGIPTLTLLDPYAEVAASVLGFGSTSGTGNSTSLADTDAAAASLNINWLSPKWNAALQGGTNPATGGPAPMSLDQWRRTLITDPQYGWATTDDAKNAGVGVADHLLSVFGVPAAQGQ